MPNRHIWLPRDTETMLESLMQEYGLGRSQMIQALIAWQVLAETRKGKTP